jgi:hypothetical protein
MADVGVPTTGPVTEWATPVEGHDTWSFHFAIDPSASKVTAISLLDSGELPTSSCD